MTDRRALLGAAIMLALLAAIPAVADDSFSLPNPALTPGAVAEMRTEVICAPGYSRAHRTWRDKAGTLAKYGIPFDQAAQFEDDDLIPVCAGGDNADPRNHWPQPWALGPRRAGKINWRRGSARRRADRDDAELSRYQAAFARGWVALESPVVVP